MKRTLLFGIIVAALLWLSGCMSISCEERTCGRSVIVRRPAVEVVEVVHVPGPRPRPRRIYRRPPPWR
jgi:hypothetical protein